MGFFKKQNHPLPKFPANVRETFKRLRALVSSEELAELRQIVEQSLNELVEEEKRNDNIDLVEAGDIAKCCFFLIDHYDTCQDDKLKMDIIGAIRYFALAEDPFDETMFAGGFHDDKMVINHVLEKLGLEEWVLDVN